MKPTIEEVKEYFKDALEVECIFNGKKYEFKKVKIHNENDKHVTFYYSGVFNESDRDAYCGLWYDTYGYAKITKRRETETVTVPKKFVLDAHESACSEWKEKIEKQLPDLFPSFSVKIGDRFELDGEEYILSRVDINERINLINLKTGVPFDNALKVKNDNFITKEEFKKLCSVWKFNKIS